MIFSDHFRFESLRSSPGHPPFFWCPHYFCRVLNLKIEKAFLKICEGVECLSVLYKKNILRLTEKQFFHLIARYVARNQKQRGSNGMNLPKYTEFQKIFNLNKS